MCAPQRGHADAGATTDTFRGVRETTTVKKDPKISPASANMGTRNAVMPSTVPRPSEDLTFQAVLVRHVGRALRVDANLEAIVEVGVVREVDVVVARRAVQAG